MLRTLFALWLLILPAVHADEDHPEPFVSDADARAEVDAALGRAAAGEGRVVLVFGANWCHDSRGLANHFQQDDLRAVLDQHYEVVWIDVGWRHRNLDIAGDYGVPTIYGTPTVLIVDPELGLVNRDTMHSWHTAYSRDHAEVVRYFRQFSFSTPGGGVVENTNAYAELVEEIEAWEAHEGARLTRAYTALQDWQNARDARETPIEGETAAYATAWNAIEDHRGRMRRDRSELYAQARNAVRDAMLDNEISLSPEGAGRLDAVQPELTLDFPDYSDLDLPWEAEGWTL
jgi:hypothetical protein